MCNFLQPHRALITLCQMPCTTCSGQSSSGPVSSPWSLGNFFPTGTVSFPLTSDIACDHVLSEDGWHSFRSDAVLSHLQDSPRDDTVCREIEFLVKHKFIAATYRQSLSSVLVVRIYIIPYDLPGVQGQLRIRKQPILNRARRSLRLLLNVVEQGVQAWDGSAPGGVPLFSTASVRSASMDAGTCGRNNSFQLVLFHVYPLRSRSKRCITR